MSLFTSGFHHLKANSDLKQVQDYSCLSEERACKGMKKTLISVYLSSPTELTAVFIHMMQTVSQSICWATLAKAKSPQSNHVVSHLREHLAHTDKIIKIRGKVSTLILGH